MPLYIYDGMKSPADHMTPNFIDLHIIRKCSYSYMYSTWLRCTKTTLYHNLIGSTIGVQSDQIRITYYFYHIRIRTQSSDTDTETDIDEYEKMIPVSAKIRYRIRIGYGF